MRQIIYFSTAAERQDALMIADIVAASYRNNVSEGITGLLVAAGHRYLHVVEGASRLATETLDRIRRDRRHVGVTVLVNRKIPARTFESWSVAFDGEPEFGDFFTLEDLLQIMRRQIIDRAILSQLDCFERSFVLSPPQAVPSPWTLAANYLGESALDSSH